jgi:DNA-binding GntR family transcriptional regulator
MEHNFDSYPVFSESRSEAVRQNLSLSQKAYEMIRARIVNLQIAPGQFLDETRLQSDLGLGRTPIREALLRLSHEKLVTIVPRRGIFVNDIGIEDLQKLFEVRIVLEGLAARLAAQRGTEAHWTQMDLALSRLDQNQSIDNSALLSIDESCHLVLYDAASNEILRDMLTTLYALSKRLWVFLAVTSQDTCSWLMEHAAILDALRTKDAARAGILIEQHIQSYQEHIHAAILGTSLPS